MWHHRTVQSNVDAYQVGKQQPGWIPSFEKQLKRAGGTEREALEVTIKAMLSRLEEAKVNKIEVEGGR